MSTSSSLSCLLLNLAIHFFSDPEPRIINILYGWSGIYGHFVLWSSLFSFVEASKQNVFVCCENEILKIWKWVFGMKYKQKDCFKTFHFIIFLLTITDENKSRYVYVKDYNIFMCNKTKTWKTEKPRIKHL